MPNTYSQIYLQFVFAVKHRESLIPKEYKEELHKYITSLAQARKSKMLAIHCMPDHVHMFVGYNPGVLISDFVRQIKVESHEFIDRRKIARNFSWQTGYGVFSYAHSQIGRVCNYIEDQVAHHSKKSFHDEYIQMLKKTNVDYDERYLFDWIENVKY
jgi:putative transposase